MGTTTETVVLEYKLKLDEITRDYDKLEDMQKDVQAQGRAGMQAIAADSKKAATATKEVTKNTSLLKDKLNEIGNNLPFANQIKQVYELGSALTSAGNSGKVGSNGMKLFMSTLATGGLVLFIAAIAGLIAYFKRTDEGATRLAGAMAAFNAVVDLVTGSLVGFGEAVFRAGRSFDDFAELIKTVSTQIGGYLLNRILAPIFLVKDGFDALILAVQGKGTEAFKELQNGVLQFLTGFEDLATKTGEFTDKALAAAQAAYEWEKAMDALQDKMREDSSVIKENNNEIARLVIASKNKITTDEEALQLLDQASKLEKQNLAIEIGNEKTRLKLIQERNKRESDSINQDIKSGQTRRSINDELAQEERDAINKIIELQGSSDNLLEKIQNRRDAKEEEIFQNQIKRIASEETLKENTAKADYINGVTNAEQLEEALYQIKLDGLQAQKELLVSNSRDIVEVDKAILDLQLQNQLKSDKEKAAAKKKANDDLLAALEERLKEEDRLADERRKEDEKKQKEHEAKILAIKQSGFELADTLASGFADISAQKKQIELEAELNKSEKETDQKQKDLQKQFDNGLITEEQFNAKKIALDQKQAAKEAEIKKKKFQADKKAALIQVAIDTALSIAKAFAQLGPIGGALGAALAAAMGLAQAAIIQAKPEPKFKDGVIDLKGPGTGKSDSIKARLSKGESVMTAEETQQYMGPLKAMRAKKYNQFVQQHYVAGALEKQQRENISRRHAEKMSHQRRLEVISHNNTTDMSETNKLLKKNGTVRLNNINELAKAVTKENFYNSKLFQ